MFHIFAIYKMNLDTRRMSQGYLFDNEETAKAWIELQPDKSELSVMPLTVCQQLWETTGQTHRDLRREAINKLTPFERDALGLQIIPED